MKRPYIKLVSAFLVITVLRVVTLVQYIRYANTAASDFRQLGNAYGDSFSLGLSHNYTDIAQLNTASVFLLILATVLLVAYWLVLTSSRYLSRFQHHTDVQIKVYIRAERVLQVLFVVLAASSAVVGLISLNDSLESMRLYASDNSLSMLHIDIAQYYWDVARNSMTVVYAALYGTLWYLLTNHVIKAARSATQASTNNPPVTQAV